MAFVCKNTGKWRMASQSIEIRSLYKIFGSKAENYIDAVKGGMSKTELNAKHGHVLGLSDINITMPGGQITVIMGLSGSGKSTLIRHVNRLIDPTAGEILYGGTDVCRLNEAELLEFRRHKTAMVFQKYGLEVQGIDKGEREEKADVWIKRVGLEGFSSHYPNQLSGGMQQRVGLARALTNNAEILLMDEAYSALDPLIRVDMQTVLLELQKELKKTVVFITHDLDEALRLGDKIAILRDGEIIQQGTAAEIVMSPADSYIEAFVEEVNRGRVIRLGAIVQPEFSGQSRLQLGADMTVEEGLRALVREDVGSAVIIGENGKALGSVTTDAIMRCLVRTTPGAEKKLAEAG
jgi:glycine betaine/proline transport system ATP-binding protein